MSNIKEIKKLLIARGCILTKETTSKSFGECNLVYKASDFELIIIQDRSHLSIDLVKNKEKYDLALVFVLLTGDKSFLLEGLSIKNLYTLLDNEFENLYLLFSDENFKKTKKSLIALEKKRVKMLFRK